MVQTGIKEMAENFEITNEGKKAKYLGVKVEKLQDKRIKISQPCLIEQILKGLGFNEKTKIK